MQALDYRIDVNTLEQRGAKTLELNAIGVCQSATDRPVVFEPYGESRELGGFILIDRISNATVGAGLIALRAAPGGQRPLAGASTISRGARAR